MFLRRRFEVFKWKKLIFRITSYHTGYPKKLCPVCEAALEELQIRSSLFFTQLHRPGFNLEFETLYESI